MTLALSFLEFADKHAEGLGALIVGAFFVIVLAFWARMDR